MQQSGQLSDLKISLESARNLPAEQLPSLLGQLELIKMTAIARLTSDGSPHEQTDRLLNSREAAELFGISEAFLYRNHAHYDFTIRLGRKLLFSHLGIQRFLQRRGLLRTKRPGGASDSPVK